VQSSCGVCTPNAFVSELSPNGTQLLFSTYLGGKNSISVGGQGNSTTYASGVATDSAGNIYVTGTTDAVDFPTTAGAFETTPGLSSPFVTKIMVGQTPPPNIAISPATIPQGTAGVLYSPVTFTTTGGQGTVTITEVGNLPTGMTFSNGTLSGTPIQTGSYPLTINARDSQNDTGTESLTLTINCPTIVVTPTSLATGTSGAAYPAVTFTETGGVGATTFSESGALPTGMTFLAAVLSGTPTQSGSFSITVTATDSNGCSGNTNDTLTINTSTGPPPAVVTDNETITVNDTETFPDVPDTETIHVTDTPIIRVVTPLTVTANNTTRAYGAANPNFTGTVTGALNGDSFVETFSTTAIASSPIGMYPITPTVTGTDLIFYAVNAVNGALTITQAGTSVQLSTSANGPVADGTPVILTANVASATTGTPTGTLTFLNGSTSLGTATLSQGVATLTTSALPSGHDNITASYSGDANFTPSTSPVETVSVNSPDYTISANPSSLTLAAGQSGSTTITVTPEGFSGMVSFSCGTLPSYLTCTFNPSSSLSFSSGATAPQTLTLNVAVASTIGMLEQRSPVVLAMAMPLSLLGLLPLVGKMRKRLRLYLGIVALALTFAGAITGCTSPGGSTNLPPAGTQTFTVTAAGSGNISHQLQLTITVTN
jgi:hypothetical protein